MILSSTTVNGAVSNDSNNNITMSVGNTVIANVNSSGIFFESGKKAIYTGATLQVVSSYTASSITTTSGSPVDTNLSASITPTSSSSKILVLLSTNGYVSRGSTAVSYGDMFLYMIRGSTQIASSRNAVNFGVNTWTDIMFAQNGLVFLDSPATTSSTTYKLQVSVSNSQSLQVPFQGFATMTLMEIAA